MKRFKGTKMLSFVFSFTIFLICANILYLGITGKHFLSQSDIASYAEDRNTKTVTTVAQRGDIYTSDGEVVATTVTRYKLAAILSEYNLYADGSANYVVDIEEAAELLAPILGMDEAELLVTLSKDSYQVEFGSYGSNLSTITKNAIEALEIPGLVFTETSTRNYPYGDFASYLVGYSITETDTVSKIVGKMGFELVYNDELSGEDGYIVYQSDVNNYVLPDGIVEQVDSVDGSDLYLTINSTIQKDLDIAFQELAENAEVELGTVAIMEATTGKILAMSNYPSFDPNVRDVENYTNFFIETAYECGSVFKPFVYASSVDQGLFPTNQLYTSGKYVFDSSTTISDWNNGVGFGDITFEDGLALSSNVGVVTIANSYVDEDELIADYLELGFFSSTEVDGMTSAAGIAGYDNGPLEYLTTSFGQGSTVTAYQMLRAYSVFANDGKTVEPYFVEKIVNEETGEVSYVGKTTYSQQIFSSETIDTMNEMLLNNIYGDVSIATAYQVDGVTVMGKTGTAQVARSDGYSGYRTDVNIKSFAGIASYEGEDSEIIIYVSIQSPEYNSNGESAGAYLAEFVTNMISTSLAVQSQSEYEDSVQLSFELGSYINQSTSYATSSLESKQVSVQLIGNGDTIIEQEPTSQTIITTNDQVFLKTDGTQITIPDFTGWSRKDVLTYCNMANIDTLIEGESGYVVSQSIEASTIYDGSELLTITIE
ncbi:penicillin-binding protein [Tannockella kyphosi]|uniref:penicillin-binding protein n=1 Tax=Tannockella kyphosi TaxID=2899121 RepID=UPI002013604E|nr:penicillin-binding protein [Tannockella kyphosi]